MCPAARTTSDERVANSDQPQHEETDNRPSKRPKISSESAADESFEKKVRAAKRAARSELSVSKGEWTKHGFAQNASLVSTDAIVDTVPRVDAAKLTVEEFAEHYEKPRVPVVITGLCKGWPAVETWTPEQLLERYGDHKFKVGSDDDGYAVRLKLKHFWRYANHPGHGLADDSPLYIFDGTFADRRTSRGMRRDYSVPSLFSEDLMKHAGEHRRPPYRWLVMGGTRSGTGMHLDPLATSAWNALLLGHKRWALFPLGTPKQLLKPPGLEREAATWFAQVYPVTQKQGWPAAKPIDIIQGPGETVYVPAGWWHAVINLDMTVAVTQNFCSTTNFPSVWRHTKKGRPKMSAKWLRVLREVRSDLAGIADGMAAAGDDESGTSSSSSSSSSCSSSSSSSSSSSDSEGPGQPEQRSEGLVEKEREQGR